MKPMIQKLSVLLVVQLILTLAVSSSNKMDTAAFSSNKKLLGLTLSDVDQISITQIDKPVLQLKAKAINDKESQWLLADKDDFPVSKTKLENSINKLLAMKQSWPVATTESSAKHFKVADDVFERKITFSKQGKILKTLLLGASPGFKKVYARVAGANEIYQIDYSTFEADTESNSWTDKDFLKQAENSIVDVDLPDSLKLKRVADNIIVDGLTENEQSNQAEVEKLMRDLTNLRFISVLGTENKTEYQQNEPIFQYALVLKEGETVTYTFSKLKDSKDVVLKVSSEPYYFKVQSVMFDRLQKIKRSLLVMNKAVDTEKQTVEKKD